MKVIFDATGDVIVVTGGASGICRALALAASDAGANVIVCDVDQAAMALLQTERPAIAFRHLDVSSKNHVQAVFATIEKEFGAIDSLVCGAAIQPRTDVRDMDPSEWERVLATNLNGVVWCCQAALPSMIGRRKGEHCRLLFGSCQPRLAKGVCLRGKQSSVDCLR